MDSGFLDVINGWMDGMSIWMPHTDVQREGSIALVNSRWNKKYFLFLELLIIYMDFLMIQLCQSWQIVGPRRSLQLNLTASTAMK